MRLSYRNKIKGQGFVEALIAICVSGIAIVVLLSVASRNIRQVVRNEIEDQLTQEAAEGSELLKYIVDEYNVTGVSPGSFLPVPVANEGGCVALDGSVNAPEVSALIPGCTYNTTNGISINECRSSSTDVTLSDNPDLYRILCFHPDSTANILVAKIFTGFMPCSYGSPDTETTQDSTTLNDCTIYEYTAVFNID